MGKRWELQVNDSSKDSDNKSHDSKLDAQKKLVEELKAQWKQMWSERFNDKEKAEGVSIADYTSLKVDRGTILHATRDCKALNFTDILEQHIEDSDRFKQPDINVGGWNKFIKTKITNPSHSRNIDSYVPVKKASQQPKKSGRGWLHST
jgi:hypothetical protein